jgi:hypothetical protein
VTFTLLFNNALDNFSLKKYLSLMIMFLIITPLAIPQNAFAIPVANQLIPVGVINTAVAPNAQDAFGVAYDSANDVIWATSGGVIEAFTPFNNLNIGALPIDGVTGLPVLTANVGTTPNPGSGIEALGYNAATGQLLMHVGTNILAFDPFTGLNSNVFFPAVGGSFFDGLDKDGADVYWSPEDGSRDSIKNGAIFLDNTVVAQTDMTGVWVGPGFPTITRWAGVEKANNFIYTVGEVDFGGGGKRTIGTYDLAGNFFAVDPDGSPFAVRLEDMAFDGRYLYSGSIGDSRVFVFDIVGPGGLASEVGGEMSSLDTVALLISGAQLSALWMLPLLGGAAGLATIFIKKRKN